jgi:hypothetical protein
MAPRSASPIRRTSFVSVVALLVAMPVAGAQSTAGCDPVLLALRLLDEQPKATLHLEVHEGRHPDGYRRFEIVRSAGAEQRFVDGRSVGRPSRGITPDPFMLMPESACEPAAAVLPGVRVLRYDAWAERGSSRVTMWIDTETGLPTRVEREGPELAWGRSLSRPTKPPQPQLRPTGRRIVEMLVIEAGDDGPTVSPGR